MIAGTPGDDIIVGGAGADILSGNGGTNLFAYTSMRDAGDTVHRLRARHATSIDLRTLLAALGYAGTDAVAEGWVRFTPALGGTPTCRSTATARPAAPSSARC